MLHVRRRIIQSYLFKTQPQTQFQTAVNPISDKLISDKLISDKLISDKSNDWNQLKIFNPFAMFYYKVKKK